jgi:lipoprotein-anchoring transpeptidase ErfK/SrfK
MLERRGFLQILLGGVAAVAGTVVPFVDEADAALRRRRVRRKTRRVVGRKKPRKKIAKRRRSYYKAPSVVEFASSERPGTIIIRTNERALYQVLGSGQARRYTVAVGKQGFSWSGVARVGFKKLDPPWTPPPEMIERAPKFAEWADLYKGKRDTQFRIHGTNAPGSIGTAASSGCIRMMNHEVLELMRSTRNGTKVIVL